MGQALYPNCPTWAVTWSALNVIGMSGQARLESGVERLFEAGKQVSAVEKH